MSGDTTNAVTLATIAEYEETLKNPGAYRYDSVDELFDEILNDDANCPLQENSLTTDRKGA